MTTFDGKSLGEQLTLVVHDFMKRTLNGVSEKWNARIDMVTEKIESLESVQNKSFEDFAGEITRLVNAEVANG